MAGAASPVSQLGRSVRPRRSAPSSWPRTPVIAPARCLAPPRATACPSAVPVTSVVVAAGSCAVDPVQEVAQPTPQHGVHVAIATSATAPLRHADCGETAAAAAAVVCRQPPPRGVERDERPRRLPLPAGAAMPRLLAACRGAEGTARRRAAAAVRRQPKARRRDETRTRPEAGAACPRQAAAAGAARRRRRRKRRRCPRGPSREKVAEVGPGSASPSRPR